MHQKQALNFLTAFNKILNAFTRMHTVRDETWQHFQKCFFNSCVGVATRKGTFLLLFNFFSAFHCIME